MRKNNIEMENCVLRTVNGCTCICSEKLVESETELWNVIHRTDSKCMMYSRMDKTCTPLSAQTKIKFTSYM